MGWLRLVGSLKLQVSFVKKPYKRGDILQKRPVILRSLLIEATPYFVGTAEMPESRAAVYVGGCVCVYVCVCVCVNLRVCVCVCVSVHGSIERVYIIARVYIVRLLSC